MSANGSGHLGAPGGRDARKRRNAPGAPAPRRSARCLRTAARSDVSPSSSTRPQPRRAPARPRLRSLGVRSIVHIVVRSYYSRFSPRVFATAAFVSFSRGHTAPPSPRGVRRDARDGGVVSARRRRGRGLPGPAVPHVASPPRASGLREKREMWPGNRRRRRRRRPAALDAAELLASGHRKLTNSTDRGGRAHALAA